MQTRKLVAAGALSAAAGLWPAAYCAATSLMLTPYQRLLTVSACGSAPQGAAELLGHCANCWIGMAALALAAFAILALPPQQAKRA